MTKTVLLAFVAVVLHCQITVSRGQGSRRVCYYTNWSQYRSGKGKFLPEQIDANLCTHLIFAFAELENNLLKTYEWNDINQWGIGLYKELNDLKNINPNLKTLLAVGGWNMGTKAMTETLSSEGNMQAFATQAMAFIRENDFDGLDLDFEYPAHRGSPPQDKQRFSRLLEILRATFDGEQRQGRSALLLTAAVSAGLPTVRNAYEIPQLNQNLDFVNLMSYDLHGSWDTVVGHNAPLKSSDFSDELTVEKAVNHWITFGLTPEKLVVGLPTYGRGFTVQNGQTAVQGPSRSGEFTQEPGFLAYYEICEMLEEPNAQKGQIPGSEGAPFVVLGNQWIGYDDAAYITKKVIELRRRVPGIGGFMVWALDLDDFGGICGEGTYPLIKAMKAAMDVAITPGQPTSPPIQPPVQPTERSVESVWPFEPSPPSGGQGTNTDTGGGNAGAGCSGLMGYCADKNGNQVYTSPCRPCTHFVQCVDSTTAVESPCSPGTFFNPTTSNCDFPYNVPSCTNSNSNANSNSNPNPNPNPNTNPNVNSEPNSDALWALIWGTNSIGYGAQNRNLGFDVQNGNQFSAGNGGNFMGNNNNYRRN